MKDDDICKYDAISNLVLMFVLSLSVMILSTCIERDETRCAAEMSNASITQSDENTTDSEYGAESE